jgi:NAD(P)-dependent dehydrogenase (short-subunit alcohol dehydrogenase family)
MAGRVVVITGASSGVGRACAQAFARDGWRIGLIARNEEALHAAESEAREAGGEGLALPCDVADAEAVERAAAMVEERWGQIDVWVNCAMVTVFAPVVETTPAEFKRVTEVTYLGYVYGTLAALRRMRSRDAGTIVQVGSALAYRSIPLQAAYCAAKAAVRGFTDSLRSELLHEGSHVRLSLLLLPAVNTPQSLRQRNKLDRQQQPVPPLFTPESIAERVVWAAEHAPRELAIGKPTLQALWGQAFVPGFLDRYLARTSWDAQMVDQPNNQSGDILFETLPGDPGAHGPYREREVGPDWQMRLRLHPRALLAGAATALMAGLVFATRRD